MTLRELQKLAHELRPYSDRICKIASLTEAKFRATPEGIVVTAGWGTGQLQIILDLRDLIGRPCEDSREIAKRILNERLREKETTDARNDSDLLGDPPDGAGEASSA